MAPPISRPTFPISTSESIYDDATSVAASSGAESPPEVPPRTTSLGHPREELNYISVASFGGRHPDLRSNNARTPKGGGDPIYATVDHAATAARAEELAAQRERDEIYVDVSECGGAKPSPDHVPLAGGGHSQTDDYATVRKRPVNPEDKVLQGSEAFGKAHSELADVMSLLVKGFAKGRPAGFHKLVGSKEVYGAQAAVRELQRGLGSKECDKAVGAMSEALIKLYGNDPKRRDQLILAHIDLLVDQAVGELDKKERQKFVHHAQKGGWLAQASRVPLPVAPFGNSSIRSSSISQHVLLAIDRHAQDLSTAKKT